MKALTALLSASLAAIPALAQQKPCEELKSEITARLEAKGVKNYQLDMIATADVKDQTVVGSCEAGSKKIVYKRELPMPSSGQPEPKTPAAPKPH